MTPPLPVRRLSRRKKALFLLCLLGGIVGCLELGLGLLFARASRRYLHPFLGLVYRPDQQRTQRTPDGHSFTWETNRFGARGGTLEAPKPEREFRIVTLGGSSTACSLYPHRETWPGVIETVLARLHPERSVRVFNFAMDGATSWDNLQIATLLVLPRLEPDLILYYQGWNDVRFAFFDSYPHPLGDLNRGHQEAFFHSSLLQLVCGHLGAQHEWLRPDAVPIDDTRHLSVHEFLQNTKTLAGACRAHGVPLVVVPQAYCLERYPRRGEGLGIHFMASTTHSPESLEANLRLERVGLEDLAAQRELGVRLVDVAPRLRAPSLFLDDVHLNREGMKNYGETAAAAIAEMGLISVGVARP